MRQRTKGPAPPCDPGAAERRQNPRQLPDPAPPSRRACRWRVARQGPQRATHLCPEEGCEAPRAIVDRGQGWRQRLRPGASAPTSSGSDDSPRRHVRYADGRLRRWARGPATRHPMLHAKRERPASWRPPPHLFSQIQRLLKQDRNALYALVVYRKRAKSQRVMSSWRHWSQTGPG